MRSPAALEQGSGLHRWPTTGIVRERAHVSVEVPSRSCKWTGSWDRRYKRATEVQIDAIPCKVIPVHCVSVSRPDESKCHGRDDLSDRIEHLFRTGHAHHPSPN